MSELDPEVYELAREESGDCVQQLEDGLLEVESGGGSPDMLDGLFRAAHSIKGTAGMVGWADVAELAHAIEDRLAEARERGELAPDLVAPLLEQVDGLRRALAGGPPDDGEPAGADAEALPEPEHEPEPAPETPPEAEVPPPAAKPAAAPTEHRSIRVPAEKVDRMLETVGESLLHRQRLEHLLGGEALDERAAEELDRGDRLLSEFHESVLELRTLPLSSITAGFPRALRDLAAAEGKEAELVISGGEIQLDRVILDGMGETITHMLRNAVAHGIEPPDERERLGKPRRAVVRLRAAQRAGMVAVELADDGRGVSPELLERAQEVGSLADVLAAPGVTSAATVSGVAGRGVGLDAVRRQVEDLGGSLEVASEPGQGTTVTMLLPLTLALLHVLLCERAGQAFCIPLSAVMEVVSVGETTRLAGQDSIEIRGHAVPLGDLAAMLGGAAGELGPDSPAVVVQSRGRPVGVRCDRLLGEEEVVVKPLGNLLAGVPGYLGASVLGDARVALIVDPNHLLRARGAVSASGERTADHPEPPRILVVDDQLAVRSLQRNILESAGYRVEAAESGRTALEVLRRDADIDLVLTDVQMPELDGLDLLRSIRADENLSALPAIVVTSVGSPEDRQRGMEAGADAYLIKDAFDQRTLLDAVERLIGR